MASTPKRLAEFALCFGLFLGLVACRAASAPSAPARMEQNLSVCPVFKPEGAWTKDATTRLTLSASPGGSAQLPAGFALVDVAMTSLDNGLSGFVAGRQETVSPQPQSPQSSDGGTHAHAVVLRIEKGVPVASWQLPVTEGSHAVLSNIATRGSVVVVAGFFSGRIANQATELVSRGSLDGFIAVLSLDLKLQKILSFGGPKADVVSDLALAADGQSFFVAGDFVEEFQVAEQALAAENQSSHSFILALDNTLTVQWIRTDDGRDKDRVRKLLALPSGGLLAIGEMAGSAPPFDSVESTSSESTGSESAQGQSAFATMLRKDGTTMWTRPLIGLALSWDVKTSGDVITVLGASREMTNKNQVLDTIKTQVLSLGGTLGKVQTLAKSGSYFCAGFGGDKWVLAEPKGFVSSK